MLAALASFATYAATLPVSSNSVAEDTTTALHHAAANSQIRRDGAAAPSLVPAAQQPIKFCKAQLDCFAKDCDVIYYGMCCVCAY